MLIEMPELELHDAQALRGMFVPERTALLVVDIQVDFAASHGFFGRAGANMSAVELAIDTIERLLPVARQAGLQVVFVRAIDPSTSIAAMQRFLSRSGRDPGHAICRSGDVGADYYRLRPETADLAVEKHSYDAFHQTDLAQILRARRIESIVVTGVATDCCVDSTARAAFLHDFDVFVVSDACASGASHLHFGSLSALSRNAATLTTANELIEALARQAPANG